MSRTSWNGVSSTTVLLWRRVTLLLLVVLWHQHSACRGWLGGRGRWRLNAAVHGLQPQPQPQPPPPQPPQSRRRRPPFAVLAGGTGRTGRIAAGLLLAQGFGLRVLTRNVTRAAHQLAPVVAAAAASNNSSSHNSNSHAPPAPPPVVEYFPCDLGDAAAVRAAFAFSNNKGNHNNHTAIITHVVFCAGGDGADYRAVNHRGLAACAREASCGGGSGSVRQMVVISTAWATRPYSIAALLFNALFEESTPMAAHCLGEREVRRAAAGGGFDYVILRPGALRDEPSLTFPDAVEKSYARLFPDYDDGQQGKGLTYMQGDRMQFLGPPGRFGMTRAQLAHAVVTAVNNVEGRYTVEVTNRGAVPLDDASVYPLRLRQDDDEACGDGDDVATRSSDDDIWSIHKRAVAELKIAALAASLTGILLIGLLGWIRGIVLFLALDALMVLVWRKFFADRQAT